MAKRIEQGGVAIRERGNKREHKEVRNGTEKRDKRRKSEVASDGGRARERVKRERKTLQNKIESSPVKRTRKGRQLAEDVDAGAKAIERRIDAVVDRTLEIPEAIVKQKAELDRLQEAFQAQQRRREAGDSIRRNAVRITAIKEGLRGAVTAEITRLEGVRSERLNDARITRFNEESDEASWTYDLKGASDLREKREQLERELAKPVDATLARLREIQKELQPVVASTPTETKQNEAAPQPQENEEPSKADQAQTETERGEPMPVAVGDTLVNTTTGGMKRVSEIRKEGSVTKIKFDELAWDGTDSGTSSYTLEEVNDMLRDGDFRIAVKGEEHQATRAAARIREKFETARSAREQSDARMAKLKAAATRIKGAAVQREDRGALSGSISEEDKAALLQNERERPSNKAIARSFRKAQERGKIREESIPERYRSTKPTKAERKADAPLAGEAPHAASGISGVPIEENYGIAPDAFDVPDQQIAGLESRHDQRLRKEARTSAYAESQEVDVLLESQLLDIAKAIEENEKYNQERLEDVDEFTKGNNEFKKYFGEFLHYDPNEGALVRVSGVETSRNFWSWFGQGKREYQVRRKELEDIMKQWRNYDAKKRELQGQALDLVKGIDAGPYREVLERIGLKIRRVTNEAAPRRAAPKRIAA
ncbi:hypothetical protein HY624_02270 [Candidatus Uhrbacteria bacterium]|nr:hypothetical protein [Candidatus Uhrbacteria bacterium]